MTGELPEDSWGCEEAFNVANPSFTAVDVFVHR